MSAALCCLRESPSSIYSFPFLFPSPLHFLSGLSTRAASSPAFSCSIAGRNAIICTRVEEFKFWTSSSSWTFGFLLTLVDFSIEADDSAFDKNAIVAESRYRIYIFNRRGFSCMDIVAGHDLYRPVIKEWCRKHEVDKARPARAMVRQ